MLRRKIFEVCTGSLQSVINAVEGGAERIELCESLNVDGLTPSWNLFRNVRAQFPHLIMHILICDSFNRVVFIQQGYTIGTGEHLLRVLRKL